jgi:adenosylhomocysteine nucleosidase
MKHLAILCALPQEVSPFKRQIQGQEDIRLGGVRGWVGQSQGKKVTLVQTGIGKVSAAAAAQLVITHFAPEAIFSCGTAGSLDTRCQIGDIVVGTTTLQHDYGFILPETFVHFGIPVYQQNRKKHFFKEFAADTILLNVAQSFAEEQNAAFKVFSGSILTGDQVIFSSKKRQALAEQFKALAVDMESAAIAQLCTTNEIPFLAIRGISDDADESIQLDISAIDPNALSADPSASVRAKIRGLTSIIRYVSSHPAAFRLSLQTRQNIKIAAKNSANYTLRVLQRL